ncbi:Uncharacterised protein (plasmid) [Legionella adelaidensis]|jgi:opacity protein-like surface antigen|uniref:Outer membrane protein beta-barrel domain-containing protein n=1 Tax=Legionella adelaidensis TaxID=45056 RepID=A0A0W0R4D9_9GAMM|nr:outer membrane beta-barrel protein [Legionella adelaidensis]KTC65936.1 hypothetical protein Lade_0594 [Legionella adelaidensis]VEH85556.1 Uncharacterised protein [Legionella adelaidensis]
MKKLFLISLLLVCVTPLNAANPKTGWYGQILVGGNYAFPNDITFIDPNTLLVTEGDLKYTGYGQIALAVGYRFFPQFRAEAEFLLMGNRYKEITANGNTYIYATKNLNLRFEGQTNTGAVLANGIFDFVGPGMDFAPYVGAGIGYARINNSLKFYLNNQYVQGTRINDSFDTPVVQGILGAGYYLDDLTWFGLDFRYMVAQALNQSSSTEVIDQPLHVASINLSFSGMIDCW